MPGAARAALAVGILAAIYAWLNRARAAPLVAPAGAERVAIDPAQVAAYSWAVDAEDYGGWFAAIGARALVVAIAAVESDFRPWVVGDDGRSIGMMQMQASTAADLGYSAEDLFDWQTAVRAAMAYLKWSYDYLATRLDHAPTFSEWVGAYNAGVGNVAQHGYIPQAYVRKVQAALDRWGA
jgi:hypothetical protein